MKFNETQYNELSTYLNVETAIKTLTDDLYRYVNITATDNMASVNAGLAADMLKDLVERVIQ